LGFVSETQTSGPAFTCTNPPAGGTGNTTCSIATLANGGVATYQLVYSLGGAVCRDSVTNTATVSSLTLDTNPTNDVATVITPVTSLCFWALLGKSAVAKTGTYVNQTTAVQSISTLTTDNADFAIRSNSCNGRGLTPGGTCTFQVVFTPSHLGQQNADLFIGGTSGPVILPLTGNSTAPSPQAPTGTLSAATLTFTAPSTSTATQTLTITNTGTDILDVGAITTSGDPAFSVSNNSCTGGHFPHNASCHVQVIFHPTHTGAVSGQLTIVDDAYNAPEHVTLSGTGT
jgi:hypothetical protein